MERRRFLALLGTPAYAELARRIGLQTAPDNSKADVKIRISPVEMEVAPRRMIKTTGYNGSAPGPVLRLREGQPITVEVSNETKIPELVHWHGLFVPSEVDGSEEEGTPPVHRVRCGVIRSSRVLRGPVGITAMFPQAGI